MLYLYAILGIVMMSGIMSIFEMGLSLTGRSMLPTPPDAYLPSMKDSDVELLKDLADESFSVSVLNKGLCGALDKATDEVGWTLIGEGNWANSCQLNRGSRRVLVREELDNKQMPYPLFSCALSGKNVWYDEKLKVDRCSFERE